VVVTPAALTITADNKSVPYSDPNPWFTASYSGFANGEGPAVLSGTLAFTTSRTTLSNVGTYSIIPSGLTSTDYTITFVNGTLTVTPEDVQAQYTGTLFAVAALNTTTATVTLSATVQDVSATASDPAYGDIRTATVTFVNRGNGAILSSNVPVGLVNPGDITAGTATCNVTLPTGTTATDYTIGIIIGGNYARNSGLDNTVVDVTQNLPGFITGGGYIVASASAGAYAADGGTNVNFGFNVKYKPSQSHLQGHANIIIRKTVGETLHVYQIQTNSIVSMGFGPASNQAQYTAKANITDITDPANPIGIAGNQTFQMTLTDNGAGSSDTIGFTVWNPNGGLQFSSNWNANLGRTVEQVLAGGSLVVHSSNQTAAGGPGHNLGVTPLTAAQLQPIWTEALARWEEAGATAAQVSPLANVAAQIVSLPPGILARTGPDTIWISQDAAGYGWFIDPTPSGDRAFNGRPTSAAQGRMDLLSVVAHEMGHIILAMEESAQPNDVMTEALPVGVRRLPTPQDLGLEPSAAGANGQNPLSLTVGAPGASPGVAVEPGASLRRFDRVLAATLLAAPTGLPAPASAGAVRPQGQSGLVLTEPPVLLAVQEGRGSKGAADTPRPTRATQALDMLFADFPQVLTEDLF
jgi:hypothetical protein